MISQAAGSTQTWRNLTAGIKPVYPMRTHVEELEQLYEGLLSERRVEIGAAS